MREAGSLYEKDFYAWTQQQAKLVRDGVFKQLDVAHLYEEIEDMGNRHVDEIESRLEKLLMHLLKWEFQPTKKTKSWYKTIVEQRSRIALRLKKMPSLKAKISELIDDAYSIAVKDASAETGLAKSVFPAKCKWTLKQLLDDEYFPN